MGRNKRIPRKIDTLNNRFMLKIDTKTNRNLNCTVLRNHSDINELLYLGEVWIGKTSNIVPSEWKKCKTYFLSTENEDILKMEFECKTFVVVNVNTEIKFLKGLLSSKALMVKIKQKEDLIFGDLYFSSLPFDTFYPTIGETIKTAFALLYNIEFNSSDLLNEKSSVSIIEINRLYEELKCYRTKFDEVGNINVQHPALIPKLRPYQEEAVRWMIKREEIIQNSEHFLNPLYEEIQLKGGKTIYLNKLTGYIEIEPPLVSSLRTGGILADEMGLGKTVEVLACILSNPHKTFNANNTSSLEICKDTSNQNATLLEKQPKKRRKSISNDAKLYVDKPKKLKISKSLVKNSKNKSNTFLALQAWYQNTLSEMSVKKPEAVIVNKVQCICGNLNEKGIIKCVDCPKYQHISCFKYKNQFGDYRCPQCWEKQPYMECKGTFIVCPKSLLNQWLSEICKHIQKGLKVLHYEGRPIYPVQLKEYDIVLTTYNVLQSEFHVTDVGETTSLRRAPRYSPPGSPITRMKWWRVCLDEAQTVEISSSIVSEMASKIKGEHRWAVTGTPITKDISDVYGLISYLQMEPYEDIESWNYLFYLPYLSGNKKPLYDFLAKIMWRSTKKDVENQIDIPKQTTLIHTAEFSAVERYFYRREHELSASDFLNKLRHYDLDTPIIKLSKANLKNILGPLLSIRQSCSHPNAVRGRYLATRKQVTSMRDLLKALIDKNTNESEECLRIAISAINGIAGIYLLLDNPEMAVEEYRKVLQLSARFNKETVETNGLTIDKLQLIHTFHNLADVLDMQPSVPATLRDATLREDCLKLQEKFMEKYIKETITSLKDSETATGAVIKLQEKQTLVEGQWYEELLKWVSLNDLSEELGKKVRTALENADINKFSEFSNEKKLLYRVANWSQDVMNLRDETMSLLEQMYSYSDENEKLQIAQGLVELAAGCHLRPQKRAKKENRKKCLVCVVNSKMREYESKLFNTTKLDDPDKSNKGNWKPTVFELVLKALLSVGKAKDADPELLENGNFFCSQVVKMKKEFKEKRKFWTFLDRQICAKDELDMCKIRLSLKDPSNEQPIKNNKIDRIIKQLSLTTENRLETIHMLDPHELDYQRAVLEGEANQQLKALEKSLGTHGYLETLKRDQGDKENPDPCPICKTSLEEHRSVLPCGHCYCLDCIQILLEQTSAKKISCSICREKHKIEDISYIRTGNTVKELDLIKIKGNYSTKIEAVIKLILKLKTEDETVKVLVFSTWVEILKIIKNALEENDVTSELFLNQKLPKSLTKFKDSKENVTTLLLPIHLGSRGLNLTEATHVVVVEPLLDPGDELQAIGRVHRIGQTKPTFVHKFYIKQTIEENIHLSTSSDSEKWDKNKVTLNELHDLFLVTENVDEPPQQTPSSVTEEVTAES